MINHSLLNDLRPVPFLLLFIYIYIHQTEESIAISLVFTADTYLQLAKLNC